MIRKLSLVFCFLASVLAFSAEKADCAARYTVSKWAVDSNYRLSVELTESNGSIVTTSVQRQERNGDVFWELSLPSGTLFVVPPQWSIDSVPGSAVGREGEGTLLNNGLTIRFKAGNAISFSSNGDEIPITARVGTPLVMAHYVTWFQTPETSGRYSFRWTLHREEEPDSLYFNPYETMRGQAKIASYNYPLTGPYDSSDPDLLRYQVALMKMSGIDGVIIDFYGIHENKGEYEAFFDSAIELVNVNSRNFL